LAQTFSISQIPDDPFDDRLDNFRWQVQMKLPFRETNTLGVAPIFLPYKPEQRLLQHGSAPFAAFFLCCFSNRSNGMLQFAQINLIILSTLAI